MRDGDPASDAPALRAVAAAFDRLSPGAAEAMADELGRRRERRRRRRLAVSSFSLASALAVGALLLRPAFRPTGAAAATALITRPAVRMLPDGSKVELDYGAQLEVNFTPAVRSVRLVRGQGFFSVVRNPARPFIVSAASVRVRDVGTQFVVRLQPGTVAVLVAEGAVSIGRAPSAPTNGRPVPAPPPVPLAAGHRAVVSETAAPADAGVSVKPVAAEEMRRLLAWRGPRLELDRTPMAEAAAALARESGVRIEIADTQLAALRLSGVFRGDDVDGFISLLQRDFDVRVQRTSSGGLVLRSGAR